MLTSSPRSFWCTYVSVLSGSATFGSVRLILRSITFPVLKLNFIAHLYIVLHPSSVAGNLVSESESLCVGLTPHWNGHSTRDEGMYQPPGDTVINHFCNQGRMYQPPGDTVINHFCNQGRIAHVQWWHHPCSKSHGREMRSPNRTTVGNYITFPSSGAICSRKRPIHRLSLEADVVAIARKDYVHARCSPCSPRAPYRSRSKIQTIHTRRVLVAWLLLSSYH